jgi:hypothetical protein
MKNLFLFLAPLLVSLASLGQNVGIGTDSPHPSAALEITDSSRGILIPRMTMAQRNAIQNPAEGLMIYQTDSTKGYWYWDGVEWKSNSRTNAGIISNVNGITSFYFPNDSLYYYGQALNSCSYINYNGYNDWRVPTYEEVQNIIRRYGSNIFPTGSVSAYWTSSIVSQTQSNSYADPEVFAFYLVTNDMASGQPIFPYFNVTRICRYVNNNNLLPSKCKLLLIR